MISIVSKYAYTNKLAGKKEDFVTRSTIKGKLVERRFYFQTHNPFEVLKTRGPHLKFHLASDLY